MNSIEADEPTPVRTERFPSGNIGSSRAQQQQREVLLPTPVTQGDAAPGGNLPSANGDDSIVGMFKRSSHPVALFFLYFFRSAAIAVYVLCGLFTDNYVLSIVITVLLLSMDFWNTRNVAGRTLVGLRYWNQVDEEGESSWVFESRDPSIPSNPVDSKLFWAALYLYPLGWTVLLFVSLLKFSISFIPIVLLALVFNLSNVLGFTYADRDSKTRWANSAISSGMLGSMGGVMGNLAAGAVRKGLGGIVGM